MLATRWKMALISASLFLRSKASVEVQKQNKTNNGTVGLQWCAHNVETSLFRSLQASKPSYERGERVSEELSNTLSPRNWAGVVVEGCEWMVILSGAHITLGVLWVQVPNMLDLSNSVLRFVWPRIRLTVQTWGAHKSKQWISKKNGLFTFNSRKVLESGVYNRAG